MRTKETEIEFAQWLIHLGNGSATSTFTSSPDFIDIPPECNITDNIVDSVYGDMSGDLHDKVILTPKNDATLKLNDDILEKLTGEPRIYLSCDIASCDDPTEAANYPLEFLNSTTPSGMPQHRLCLKPGCIIMLLRNLDIRNGICNGTRVIVRHLHEHSIDAEVLSSSQLGKRVLIPCITLAPNDVNLPFILERR